MHKGRYIYYLTDKYNNVLNTGVTNDLRCRVAEHKAKINGGFTYRYNCDKLVYFETYGSIVDAIGREKQLKKWKSVWKDDLINTTNPEWKELSLQIGVDDAFIQKVKKHYDRRIKSLMTDNNIIGTIKHKTFIVPARLLC